MNGWCEHCEEPVYTEISCGYGFHQVCIDHYKFFISLPGYHDKEVEE